MECNRRWHIIYVLIFCTVIVSFFPKIQASKDYDPNSLDDLIHERAMEATAKQRTGVWSNVSLPSNFSGIEVSAIRLRSGSFWDRGTNYSSLYIPPGVVTFPYAKRLVMAYHNLGDWSTRYFELPGYKILSPVIGFSTFDASGAKALGNGSVRVSATGDPIQIRFPGIESKQKPDPICVKLDLNGLYQFRRRTKDNVCITQGNGHFTIAVKLREEEENRNAWRWWVVGVAGILGIILLCVILRTIYKMVRSKAIKDMEGASDNGVALETTYVTTSKMPSAPMVRTQPALEQGYAP
ncbi:hypothetical protein Tsubulata_046602 [Turnera subulata]|uniref:Uncharacterized protein n=1 Tax=Turnera subulata TaxID=218843 RepID=A0A9Q0F340_9ROSI|nr:hypothetical protein Tsubulata_046602 [Turnera subulata]